MNRLRLDLRNLRHCAHTHRLCRNLDRRTFRENAAGMDCEAEDQADMSRERLVVLMSPADVPLVVPLELLDVASCCDEVSVLSWSSHVQRDRMQGRETCRRPCREPRGRAPAIVLLDASLATLSRT